MEGCKPTEIVSVAQWIAAPAPTAPAWADFNLSSMSDVGHRACTIEFVDQPPSVVVRRAYVQQAYWYVVWLAAVVGGMWWLARRTDRIALVLAVAAALLPAMRSARLHPVEALRYG